MKDLIDGKKKQYEHNSVCIDRRLILLNKEEWDSFLSVLHASPKPRPCLERLMKEKTVLEK